MSKKQPVAIVNVGRQTLYGNPVRSRVKCLVCEEVHLEPGDTQVCFLLYLSGRVCEESDWVVWAQWIAASARLPQAELDAVEFLVRLLELDGKILWCQGCGVGSQTCHARVLESATGHYKEKLCRI